MHTRVTFGTNCRSLLGTDAADGFAPAQSTLDLDNGWNETSRISMICVQMDKISHFFPFFPIYICNYKIDCVHTSNLPHRG
jgi:hypothetical protein